MNNRDIAKTFQFLGKIMELHDESPFKTKSYSSAYVTLRKVPETLTNMSHDELLKIPGVGKAIADKIIELSTTGELELLNKYRAMTPPGVQEMLMVKGLGPKKVKVIWSDLGVVTVGELIYAAKENRLSSLKGFGAKTQASLLAQLEYYQSSKGKRLLGHVLEDLEKLEQGLNENIDSHKIILAGEFRRKCNIISSIDILCTTSEKEILNYIGTNYSEEVLEEKNGKLHLFGLPLNISVSSLDRFGNDLALTTGPESFIDKLPASEKEYPTEESFFEAMDLPSILPALRDHNEFIKLNDRVVDLVKTSDIKGVIHNHSTYSDGLNSIEEMVKASIDLGYEYILMTDHSQSAFYANGMKEDRVYDQIEEIEKLQDKYPDFDIYKGIESDILSGGGLDYEDHVLASFDVVIASIHSNLKMDEKTATRRILTAIENPYTHILGHPTGRLLLSREGYPLDMGLIIDACADNEVVIELNANPMRLDLDWRWIDYAMDKGVMVSINPDAHSITGIRDIKYGVLSAIKGGLTKEMCLNTKDRASFRKWVDTLKY